jgi:hypothetical protein
MPPTLTYPGVYIVEVPSSVHTITGVATSIGAFFGTASQGPMNTAIEIQSQSDFTRNFGQPIPGGYLGQMVQQFFNNGGSDCYVVRIAGAGAGPASVTIDNAAAVPVPVLTINAASEGPASQPNDELEGPASFRAAPAQSSGCLSFTSRWPRPLPVRPTRQPSQNPTRDTAAMAHTAKIA